MNNTGDENSSKSNGSYSDCLKVGPYTVGRTIGKARIIAEIYHRNQPERDLTYFLSLLGTGTFGVVKLGLNEETGELV